MVATLPIYDSIQDQKPSKVYTCYRTTVTINEKLEELTEETNALHQQIKELTAAITNETPPDEVKRIKEEVKPLEERASELTYESILLFFPEFSVAEFQKLDPYDYQSFVIQISEMRQKIYSRTIKN